MKDGDHLFIIIKIAITITNTHKAVFDDAVVLIAGSLPMAHARPALPLPDPVAGGVSGCGDGEGEGEGSGEGSGDGEG